MRVLGVDPGLARTGLAVVEGAPGSLRLLHAECVETAEGSDPGRRLADLLAAVESVAARHRPHAAAVEELFFASNRRSAMRVSEARGVILCALARCGLAVTAYTPLQVKEAVAGYGAASKAQVARMTRTLLGALDIPGPDDVSDACAVAVCHHHRHRGAPLRRRSGELTMSPGLATAVAAARARAAG